MGSGQFSCVAESEGGVTAENATILITESVKNLNGVRSWTSRLSSGHFAFLESLEKIR